MDACLTPQELERFARGELRGGARARAESHIARCASCRSREQAHRPVHVRTTTLPPREDAPRSPQQPRTDAPEDSIEGFRLLEEIHRGGQGVVYRALDEARGQIVAIKVLREGPFASSDQRLRFDRESELARSLDHAGIVSPHATGVSHGRPYHVMRFVEGLTLDAWVRTIKPSMRRMLEVFRDACDAVAHAHARGVVHRDLKPGNIIVDAAGRPHVVDFGVAKSSLPHEALPLTVTGEFVGTLSHASPEQAKGDPRLVDERTDVYALGVILYEMLTGRMPYPVTGPPAEVLRHVLETDPKNPSAIRPEIDDSLAAIVLRALAKEPQRRYATVASLRDDVTAYLAGLQVQAQPEGAWDLLARTARRNRRGFVVAAGFAALLLVVAVLASVQAARFQKQRDRAEAAESVARERAQQLERANAQALRLAYGANVAAASLSVRTGRVAEARRRLDAAPEALRSWEWSHLRMAVDAASAATPADGRPIVAMALTRDGLLRVARRDGVTDLDPRTLAVRSEARVPAVEAPDEGARAEIVAMSDDGARLALHWDDASWQRLGAAGRALIVATPFGVERVLTGSAWRPDAATFSPDGRLLATSTPDRVDATPRAWSLLGGEGFRLLAGDDAPGIGATTHPLAFSRDGATLLEGALSGRVRAWRVAERETAWTSPPLGSPVTALAAGPDGLAWAATADGLVRGFDAQGALVVTLPRSSPVRSVAPSPDGSLVATGDADGAVRAWARDGRLMAELRGHEAPVGALCWTTSGDALFSASADGAVRAWPVPFATDTVLLPLPRAGAVAFSADGATIAACSRDGAVRSWDVATLQQQIDVADEEGPLLAIAALPGGGFVAAGRSAGGATLPRRLVVAGAGARFAGDIPDVRALAFASDTLIAASGIGLLAAWHADGRPAWTRECEPDPVALQAATDGLVRVAWSDGAFMTVRAATGEEEESAVGFAAAGAAAAIRNDGVLALGAPLRLTELGWVPELRDRPRTLAESDLAPTALAWLPSGRRLFCGDAHGVLHVLDGETLAPLLETAAHPGAVASLAVSPDGRTVASAGDDGVRLFRSR